MAWRRPLVVASALMAWWWLMLVIHELGHVLGCLLSGATVESVVLWPWSFSMTVRIGSQAPLVDTWAGPVVGAVLPALIWLAVRRWRCAAWNGVSYAAAVPARAGN